MEAGNHQIPFDSAKDFVKDLRGLRERSEKDFRWAKSSIDERISRLYRRPRLATLTVVAELRLEGDNSGRDQSQGSEMGLSAVFNA